MVITREMFCIPFKEVLLYHKSGFTLSGLYEIVLLHKVTGSLDTIMMCDKANYGMALSYARGFYHGSEWDPIDAYPIMNRMRD